MALFMIICADKGGKVGRFLVLIPVYIWIVLGIGFMVGFGLVYNAVVDGEFVNYWMSVALIVMGIVLCLLLLHWFTWGLIIFVPKNKEKLNRLYYKP